MLVFLKKNFCNRNAIEQFLLFSRRLSISSSGTNIRFTKPTIIPKWIEINKETESEAVGLPTEVLARQVQQFKDIIRSDVSFEWTENEMKHEFKVLLKGTVDRENVHVYIEEGNLVFETRKDRKSKTSFKTSDCGEIFVRERTILYSRRSIKIPMNVNMSSIETQQSHGDIVIVDLPKLDSFSSKEQKLSE